MRILKQNPAKFFPFNQRSKSIEEVCPGRILELKGRSLAYTLGDKSAAQIERALRLQFSARRVTYERQMHRVRFESL